MQLTIPGLALSSYSRLRLFTHALPSAWQLPLLGFLSGVELTSLCLILGIPSSGTKFKKICNICRWHYVSIRTAALSKDDLLLKSNRFLITIIRAIPSDIYLGSNKLQRVASILNWRSRCRSAYKKLVISFREAVKND